MYCSFALQACLLLRTIAHVSDVAYILHLICSQTACVHDKNLFCLIFFKFLALRYCMSDRENMLNLYTTVIVKNI